MPHDARFTCLSDVPHGNRVSDPVAHFNGCLPAAKRRRFYESLAPELQQRITRVSSKVAELRHRLETTHHDSTAGARLQDFTHALAQWRTVTGRQQSPCATRAPLGSGPWQAQPQQGRGPHTAEDSVDDRVKAPVIYFKNGQPCDVPGLPKFFPHQKVTVADLLSEDETSNPILRPTEPGVLRYFHLPANNMVWVEELIARYYHDQRPESNDLFHKPRSRRPQSKTELVLQPGYWLGQRNFDASSAIHARHMRPMCSPISVDVVGTEPAPPNLVLFMPYMHWDTDRRREKMAAIVKEAGHQNLRSMSDVVEQVKLLGHVATHDTTASARVSQSVPLGQNSISRRQALADLLLAAAALLEAMDLHTEEELTMTYLHAEPPLQPRRTLDQFYYAGLRSTSARDRDQVVYRGTKPQAHDCAEMRVGLDGCSQCNEDIGKTARLTMVDQLWLWILDESTVITSFPRCWGRNKPDPSAIHKSLRMRLQHVRPGEIGSAYDLALLIVDETSRVFFDRTKINKSQPNLVELFNAAIRDLVFKSTAAFDGFLVYTLYQRIASTDSGRQGTNPFEDSDHNHLLNINPEGELLKETKDIIDELMIMMRIKEQQQAVMESFVKHIRRALMPLVRPKRPSALQISAPWEFALAASLDSANVHPDDDADRLREEQQRANAKRTLTRADNLLLDLNERISELQALLKNARNTSSSLKDLLTLKQQQAGVIEARSAVQQARLTLRQGQSIMIFTLITIVFLPLSFMASVFGMNAVELNGGLLTLPSEFRLMFSISAGIIVLAFVLAYSRGLSSNSFVTLVRSVVSFCWNTAGTWLSVKTGLYVAGRGMRATANKVSQREWKLTGTMKSEVLRREKKADMMRVAGHVRGLTRARGAPARAAREGAGSPATTGMSPYTPEIPGSPSPFLGARRMMGGDWVGDVEMGEVRRKPSSQMHLVPGS